MAKQEQIDILNNRLKNIEERLVNLGLRDASAERIKRVKARKSNVVKKLNMLNKK